MADDEKDGIFDRVGGALQAANEKAEKRRKDFEGWMHSSVWGVAFDLVNCMLSLVSVAMYVIQTYHDAEHGPVSPADQKLMERLDRVELWLTFFFLLDYIIYLYAAEQRIKHACMPLHVIDIVTIIPSLLTYFIQLANQAKYGTSESNSQLETATQLNFLRFVRVLKLLRVLRLMRSVNNQTEQGSGGEIVRQVAGMVLTGLSLVFCFAGLIQIIEISSSGMPHLKEVWGVDTFLFHDALYFTVITISTVGYGDYYPLSILGKFCVSFMILGSLATITDQVNKLVELLSIASPYARASYRAKRHPHVLLCGCLTYGTIHDFLEEFFHPDHGIQDTKVIIMGNDVPDDRVLTLLEEPAYAIRTCFLEGSVLVDSDLKRADVTKSVCNFIFCDKNASDQYEEDCTTIMRAITIKKYVSGQTAGSDANIVLQLRNSSHRHHLAVSACGDSNCQVICLDEIKMNLLGKSCICPGFSTMICNLMISASASRANNCGAWFKEYVLGCGQEIYCTDISSQLAGKCFSEVVLLLYREVHCLLFAIEIVDTQGYSRVVLNPAAYVIPDTSPKVFLIAQDQDAADAARDYGYTQEELDAMAELEWDHLDKDSSDPLDDAGVLKKKEKDKSRYPQEHSRVAKREEIKARLQKSSHVHENETDNWGLDKAVHETVEFLNGHVLVCGCPTSIEIFVHTLRSRHVSYSKLMPIVFLNPTPPSDAQWSEVGAYPEVYVVLGNPLETRDLVRAGVLTLSRAIILSEGDSNDYNDGYMRDADALFTYQSIASIAKEGVPIVCEIDDGLNVSFLCNSENSKERSTANDANENDKETPTQFTMEPPFAAGAVYVDSLQDKLAVQAFYNPNLLRIIRELVVGQAEEASYAEPNVTPSHLTFTKVPTRFHGKSYIQLFQYLIVNQMAIPLGLYRSSPWGIAKANNMSYVITNPSADILCQEEDFVYTLDSRSHLDSQMMVDIQCGYNLKGLHKKGNSNSSYICSISVNGRDYSTEAERGNHPVWNTQFSARVPEMPYPITIDLSISHGEGFKEEIYFGELMLDFNNLGMGGENQFWVPLMTKQAHDIKLKSHIKEDTIHELAGDDEDDVEEENKVHNEEEALAQKRPVVLLNVKHFQTGKGKESEDQDLNEILSKVEKSGHTRQDFVRSSSSRSSRSSRMHEHAQEKQGTMQEKHALDKERNPKQEQMMRVGHTSHEQSSVLECEKEAHVVEGRTADQRGAAVVLLDEFIETAIVSENMQRSLTPAQTDQDGGKNSAENYYTNGARKATREAEHPKRVSPMPVKERSLPSRAHARSRRKDAITSIDAIIKEMEGQDDWGRSTSAQETEAPISTTLQIFARAGRERRGAERTRLHRQRTQGLSSRDSEASSVASSSHANVYTSYKQTPDSIPKSAMSSVETSRETKNQLGVEISTQLSAHPKSNGYKLQHRPISPRVHRHDGHAPSLEDPHMAAPRNMNHVRDRTLSHRPSVGTVVNGQDETIVKADLGYI